MWIRITETSLFKLKGNILIILLMCNVFPSKDLPVTDYHEIDTHTVPAVTKRIQFPL